MTIVFLTSITDEGNKVTSIYVPQDQMENFDQILGAYLELLYIARKGDNEDVTIEVMQTKFNDFLRNIDKKVLGANNIMSTTNTHVFDFTAPTQDKR